MKLAINVIERTRCGRVAHRRAHGLPRMMPSRPMALIKGQPCRGPHRSPRAGLPPHLADPVDPEVRLKHALDLLLQGYVRLSRADTREGSTRFATWAW